MASSLVNALWPRHVADTCSLVDRQQLMKKTVGGRGVGVSHSVETAHDMMHGGGTSAQRGVCKQAGWNFRSGQCKLAIQRRPGVSLELYRVATLIYLAHRLQKEMQLGVRGRIARRLKERDEYIVQHLLEVLNNALLLIHRIQPRNLQAQGEGVYNLIMLHVYLLMSKFARIVRGEVKIRAAALISSSVGRDEGSLNGHCDGAVVQSLQVGHRGFSVVHSCFLGHGT